jgi:hypothetical protein
MALHLSISNPRTMGAEKFNYFLKSARASTIDKFIKESMTKGFDGLKIAYSRQLDSLGHDDSNNEIWWVAFHRTQIKSAVSNSGLYQTENPSITDHAASLELKSTMSVKTYHVHSQKEQLTPSAENDLSWKQLKRALQARGAVILDTGKIKKERVNAKSSLA